MQHSMEWMGKTPDDAPSCVSASFLRLIQDATRDLDRFSFFRLHKGGNNVPSTICDLLKVWKGKRELFYYVTTALANGCESCGKRNVRIVVYRFESDTNSAIRFGSGREIPISDATRVGDTSKIDSVLSGLVTEIEEDLLRYMLTERLLTESSTNKQEDSGAGTGAGSSSPRQIKFQSTNLP